MGGRDLRSVALSWRAIGKQLTSAVEWNSMFFKDVAPERPPTLRLMDPPPCHPGRTTLTQWIKAKTHMKSGGKCGQGRGEVRRERMGVDLIKIYDTHVQNSQTIERLIKNTFYQDKVKPYWRRLLSFPHSSNNFFDSLPICIRQKQSQSCQISKKMLLRCQDLAKPVNLLLR